MLTKRTLLAGFAAAAVFATAGAQAQQKFSWKYLSAIPATHDFNAKFIIPALENVKRRTNGNLDIRFVFFSETPFKLSEQLTIIRDGQAEITGWLPSYTSATYPIPAAIAIPFIAPKRVSVEDEMRIADQIYATPAVASEMKRVLDNHHAMALGHYYAQPMNFWFLKTVNSVAEMRGLKVRVFTPELADLVAGIGAAPVNIASPEVYPSLQRNVIDGVITGIGNMRGPKWSEVLKAGYIANIMIIDFFDIVNKPAYDKLPPEYQKILAEEMKNAAAAINVFMVKSITDEQHLLEKAGFKFVDVSDADYKLLRDTAREKVWPEWKKRAGPEAAGVFEKVISGLEGH